MLGTWTLWVWKELVGHLQRCGCCIHSEGFMKNYILLKWAAGKTWVPANSAQAQGPEIKAFCNPPGRVVTQPKYSLVFLSLLGFHALAETRNQSNCVAFSAFFFSSSSSQATPLHAPHPFNELSRSICGMRHLILFA